MPPTCIATHAHVWISLLLQELGPLGIMKLSSACESNALKDGNNNVKVIVA